MHLNAPPVRCAATERKRLEQLRRTIIRPALADEPFVRRRSTPDAQQRIERCIQPSARYAEV
jgi:hypothetical protein